MKSKITFYVALLLSVLCVHPVKAAETPMAGPEQKKLEKWVGNWKYEGNAKESPLGPAEKFSGTMQCQLTLKGFVLQSNWKEPDSGMEGLEIHVYDPASKNYQFRSYDNTGNIIEGSETLDGDVCKGMLTLTDAKGQSHKMRTELKFTPEGKGMAVKWERLENGKWLQFLDIKFTKT